MPVTVTHDPVNWHHSHSHDRRHQLGKRSSRRSSPRSSPRSAADESTGPGRREPRAQAVV